MAYTIIISTAAARALKSAPAVLRRRLDAKILALAENPRPSGCKTLQGGLKGHHRVRVGDYRIIYKVDDSVLSVLVVKVADRKDVYD